MSVQPNKVGSVSMFCSRAANIRVVKLLNNTTTGQDLPPNKHLSFWGRGETKTLSCSVAKHGLFLYRCCFRSLVISFHVPVGSLICRQPLTCRPPFVHVTDILFLMTYFCTPSPSHSKRIKMNQAKSNTAYGQARGGNKRNSKWWNANFTSARSRLDADIPG